MKVEWSGQAVKGVPGMRKQSTRHAPQSGYFFLIQRHIYDRSRLHRPE